MKASDIVGKRVVRVDQVRMNTRSPGARFMVTAWQRIVFGDGTVIYPVTHETDHGYYVTELCVLKPGEKEE